MSFLCIVRASLVVMARSVRLVLSLCSICGILFLLGCSKKGPPLKGKREDVFVAKGGGKSSLRARPFVACEHIAHPVWRRTFYGRDNRMPAVSLGEQKKAFMPVWTFTKGRSSDVYALNGPVASKERVYFIAEGGRVFCVSLKTGKQCWSVSLPKGTSDREKHDAFLGGGCALEGADLYVTSPTGFCARLNAETGAVYWCSKVADYLRSAPQVDGDAVYALSPQNRLEVFQRANGNLLWSHAGVPEGLQFLGASLPLVTKESVFVCYSSGEIVRLNRKTGRVLWSYVCSPNIQVTELAKISHIVAAPVLFENVLYVTASFGKTVALDIETGTPVWEVPVGGVTTPLVCDADIFVIERTMLKRLDRLTGTPLWIKDLSELAVEKDRKKAEEKKTGGALWLGPLLVNGQLYVLSAQGKLWALDPKDTRRASLVVDLKTACATPPIVSGNKVLVLSQEGSLYALAQA